MPTQETVQGRQMLNCVSKRQKAVKKLTRTQAFPTSLPTAPVRLLEDCSISRTGHNLGPIFGTERLGLNRWNCKFYSINMLNSGSVSARNFSSFRNKHGNILLRHKAFGWTHEQLRKNNFEKKQFLKHSFMASSSSLPFLKSSKRIQEAPKRLLKSQRNKTHKMSVYRGPCYPICHKVHWRGFHSSLFSLAKSDKPSARGKTNKVREPSVAKKTDETGQSHEDKKNELCHQKKDTCDKSQQSKEKEKTKEKKVVEPECRKSCLPIGKCDLPRTVPPPKMEYTKVTCPPSKFPKLKPCPPMEHFHKDDKSDMETRQKVAPRKKQICTPPPLPKPPYAPIVLCPCPPPRKIHPGPCPRYEITKTVKRPSIQTCKPKKKYPCPTGVYYCPPQKKPCNLQKKTGCEHRTTKNAS